MRQKRILFFLLIYNLFFFLQDKLYDQKYEEVKEEERWPELKKWYGHWGADDIHHLLISESTESIKEKSGVELQITIGGEHGCYLEGRGIVTSEVVEFDMNQDLNSDLRKIAGFDESNPCQFKLKRESDGNIILKKFSKGCDQMCGPGAKFNGHTLERLDQ